MLYDEHEHVAKGVCELLIKISKTTTVLVVPGNYPEASIVPPVPSIGLIEMSGSVPTSFEVESTKAELASSISQRSEVKKRLDSINRRIQQIEEGLSAHSTGSSNNATVAAAEESFTEWTEI